jgi:NADH-quinone oxidoreductase subunit M
MFGMGILSWLLVLPIIGALCIGALPGEHKATSNGARWIAFVTTILTFALSLEAWREFDPTTGGFQLLVQRIWLS